MLSRDVKTFLSLVLVHALVDCFGGVFPMFKALAELDLFWAGLISSTALFVGMVIQPLLGIWADHGYQRRFVIIGAALSSIAMVLGPIGLQAERLGPAALYTLLFVVMLISRIGQGLFHPAGSSLAGNLSAGRRATLVSLFVSVGMVGFAFSDALFTWAHRTTNGQTHWLLVPAAVVVFIAIVWCRPEHEPKPKAIAYRDVMAKLVSMRGELFRLFWIQAIMGGLMIGPIFLMPEFLEGRGYPDWMVEGTGKAVFILGAVLIMIPAGHLADRVGRRVILITLLTLGTAFYFTMCLAPPIAPVLFLFVLLGTGGCLGATNPIAVSLGQQLSPQHASMISGVLMGLAWAASSWAPWMVGALAKQPSIGEPTALLVLGFTGLPAIYMAVRLPADGKRATLAATPDPAVEY